MPFGGTTRSSQWAVLLSAAALLSAAPVSADSNDDAFVDALAKGGIVFPDHNAAISIAHSVCAELDQSNKSSVLAIKVMKETDLTMKQSGYLIGATISAYCPQYIGHTDDSTHWLNPGPPLM
jgi:hypothetical protein